MLNSTPGYLGPNEIELQIEDNERDRYGMTLDLEYRPTTFSSIYLRSLFTRNIERYSNSEFELTVAGLKDQELTNQTPTSGRFSKGSGELDLSSGNQQENLYSFTLGGKNRFGENLSVDVFGTYSRAFQNLFNIDGTFENPRETEGLLANTYNTNPFFFEITAENLAEAKNPELYILRNLNFRRDNTVEENLYETSLDLKYDLNISGMAAYIKVGGRYRSRQKEVDRSQERYDDDSEEGVKVENPYTLAEFDIPAFAPVQGGAAPNVHGDADAFRRFFASQENLNSGRIFFREDNTVSEIYSEDVNYRETVSAAYAMGVIDMNFLTLIGGVRIEHTQTVSSPYVDEGNGFEQQDFKNSYTNVLPSLHLKAYPFENFIGRLSWTNTIARPDYSQLSGASEFDFEETQTPGRYTGSFEGANPTLKPYESMNLDLSLEYYIKSGGIVSVGGFYKDIDNQIYELDSTSNNVNYEGMFFEDLRFSRNINLNTAQVYGLEASYDQAFTFLPSPFDGFGITTNASFMRSEVSFPGREGDELPLFRQPNSVYNIIPYYQKYGVELRMAITHRSAFLVDAALPTEGFVEDAVGAGFLVKDFDVYEAARTSVDLTAAYTFPSRKIKILGQVRNLTNAAEQEYRGPTTRYDRHELFGRSYFLGLSLNL